MGKVGCQDVRSNKNDRSPGLREVISRGLNFESDFKEAMFDAKMSNRTE